MANTTLTPGIGDLRQKTTTTARSEPRFRLSKSGGRYLRLAISYILLIIGAMVMLFPMLWMLGASLKPSWQILTQPLGFPSEWIHVQAGSANQGFPLWYYTDEDGERLRVFEIGSRRYTTVIDADALTELYSVPADDLSATQPTDFDGATLNVRSWVDDDGNTREVVALARDGTNLVIAPVDALAGAIQQMALAEVNAGARANLEVGDYRFQARELEDEGLTVIAVGPESERRVVAPEDAAGDVLLVSADRVNRATLLAVGETELDHYTLQGRPDDEYYIQVSSGPWQPIIDMDIVRDHAVTIPLGELSPQREMREFEFAIMPVDTVTLPDQGQTEVVVLQQSSTRALVVPVEYAESIRLSPLGRLSEPFVETIGGIAVRYRDDYEELGDRYTVAIVGQQRDMALIAPRSALDGAFDIPARTTTRVQEPRFYIENYIDALSRDLGGATFITFFGNSTLMVVLNLLGHFLSVTIVAYGFARLRAPGKNTLFLILLATMMMPFPVLLIPTYEIFQSLGMINTHWPLFVRAFFGNAFLIFLMRQFFMSIPIELEDAARIDGAHVLQILWHIMLPLSKPALATLGIFTFWWTWNAFFEPYVYLSSVRLFTVSLGLGFFKSQYTYTFHLLMAASVIAIFPIIAIFFFAQRYFIEGIQLSGLKG
jgi:multiple sugar transport system permease protein